MSDFKANMTKFDFRWGFVPEHSPLRKLSVLSIAVFKGPTSKWREGRGGKGKGLKSKGGAENDGHENA